MMTFYAAAGSYQIRNEDGKDRNAMLTVFFIRCLLLRELFKM